MRKKQRVLFLCSTNSVRSQMAEALLRHQAGDLFEVCSAGIEPGEVHALTRRALTEIGIDDSPLKAKGLDVFLGRVKIDYAIILCEKAQRDCPRFYPFSLRTLNWPFDDPVTFGATDEERLQHVRRVRDEIAARIKKWVVELDQSHDSPFPPARAGL